MWVRFEILLTSFLLTASSEGETDGEEEPGQQPVLDRAVRRSTRNRREPAWMRNSEWAR